jgi:hypothetical protein
MEDAETVLVVGGNEVAVPEILVDLPPRLSCPPEDEGSLAWNFGEVLCGDTARSGNRHRGCHGRSCGCLPKRSTRESERVLL